MYWPFKMRHFRDSLRSLLRRYENLSTCVTGNNDKTPPKVAAINRRCGSLQRTCQWPECRDNNLDTMHRLSVDE
ncbi:jg1293 [Pararge aegeria aegeria]|uniref:Jg1293 protein n=1 Tax=Pararge aegeria aegeria TaxID=348720 RepID=A0A8S4RDR3_9NEOP|nr:jg1293 [Pararge aegeria aegeria]